MNNTNQEKQSKTKVKNTLEIQVADKSVTLHFATEPNYEAASFIKETLTTAYMLKAI